MLQQIFGALKAFGQLFADGLLDHPLAGKADQRVRLGNLDVAQHRIAGGHAAGGGIGEHHDIGQAGFLELLDAHGGARHLHQAQDAFLHARAAGRGEHDERALGRERRLHARQEGLTHAHAHGAAHEGEILHAHNGALGVDTAIGNQHGILLASLRPGGLQPVHITLLVLELQRVLGHARGAEQAVVAVEQLGKAGLRADAIMMLAAWADTVIVLPFLGVNHGAAILALGPKIVGRVALGKKPRQLLPGTRNPAHAACSCRAVRTALASAATWAATRAGISLARASAAAPMASTMALPTTTASAWAAMAAA